MIIFCCWAAQRIIVKWTESITWNSYPEIITHGFNAQCATGSRPFGKVTKLWTSSVAP